MDGYQDACPDQVEEFRKEVKWLNVRLMQDLEDQFKEDVKVKLQHSNSKWGHFRWKLHSGFQSSRFMCGF